MERNVDKIKRLEHELGRWKKKADVEEKLRKAAEIQCEAARGGNLETQIAVNALLTAVVMEHGTVYRDPNTGEKISGWLSVPYFDAMELRKKYEIHSRRDEKNRAYDLRVVPREGTGT